MDHQSATSQLSAPHHNPSNEPLVNDRSTSSQDEDGTEARSNSTQLVPDTLEQDVVSGRSLMPRSAESAKHDNNFNIKDWLWEFSSAAVSLACLVAVVVLLSLFHGKALSSWSPPVDFTLNTLVAVLSALSTTALLVPVASCISQLKWIHFVRTSQTLREVQIFDDASRGPWGSLELIARLHVAAPLASWGSLITILALLMGPFAQQLLSYPSRQMRVNSSSAVLYASDTYPRPSAEKAGYIDPPMQGAILNGLYNLSAPIKFKCPGMKCEWDDYSTLAVQSRCEDVTSKVFPRCSLLKRSDSDLDEETLCTYETPSGFLITANRYMTAWANNTIGSGRNRKIKSTTSFNSTTALANRNQTQPPSLLVGFAFARIDSSSLDRPHVTECEMHWCARIVKNASVLNGTLHPGVSTDIDIVYNSTLSENGSNIMFYLSEDPTKTDGDGTLFYVNEDAHNRTREYLTEIFSFSSHSGLFAQALGTANLTETVAGISASMTYAIAQSRWGEDPRGRVIEDQVYIHVNWPWIILPVMEVGMAIAFLLCTIILTRERGLPAWKTSAIVPFLTSMDGWESKELRPGSWREIAKRSKHMRGLLVPNMNEAQYFVRTDARKN